MRKLRPALIVLCVFFLFPASSTAGPKGYCSPTGDYCQEVRGTEKRPIFILSTFALRGDIDVCVRTPAAEWTCKTFPLREGKLDQYVSKVRWYKHFPKAGPGNYRVSWRQGEDKIGKTMRFKIPK